MAWMHKLPTCACGHVRSPGSSFGIRSLANAVTDTLYTGPTGQKSKLGSPYSDGAFLCHCCRSYTCGKCRSQCIERICQKVVCRLCWIKSEQSCHVCVERRQLKEMSVFQYCTMPVSRITSSLYRLHRFAVYTLDHAHLMSDLLQACGLHNEIRSYQHHLRLTQEFCHSPKSEMGRSTDGENSLGATGGHPSVNEALTTAPSSDEDDSEDNDRADEANTAERSNEQVLKDELKKEKEEDELVWERCAKIRRVLLATSGLEETDVDPTSSDMLEAASSEDLQNALSDLAKIKEHIQTSAQRELCVLCHDSRIDCVFLHCGHQVACLTCGDRLNTCPICRRNIDGVLRTYRP